ncbi:MAG TPA: hypothetical protein VHU81_13985 [Thermoanaerobaculia bacterium]|nr:hypothetical protein [Thermoanaerobaculia bacterium]
MSIRLADRCITFATLALSLALISPPARADHITGSFGAALSPVDVEVSHDNAYVYVSLAGGFADPVTGMGNRVLKIDASSLTQVAAAQTTIGLGLMAIRPYVPTAVPPVPQDRLYVVSAPDYAIKVFSLTPSLAHVATIPLGCTPEDVSFDPNGNRAYVSCQSPATLKVINVTGGTNGWGSLLQTINLDGTPHGLTVTNQTGVGVRVYVAIEKGFPFDPKVAVVDPVTALVSYFSIPPPPVTSGPAQTASQPVGVGASLDGSKIYVTLVSSQTFIFQASNPTGPFTQVFSYGNSPVRLATVNTPSGERVYITDAVATSTGQWSVTRINGATGTRLGPLYGFHKKPAGIAGSPNGLRVYVASSGWNVVDVIDTTLPD